MIALAFVTPKHNDNNFIELTHAVTGKRLAVFIVVRTITKIEDITWPRGDTNFAERETRI